MTAVLCKRMVIWRHTRRTPCEDKGRLDECICKPRNTKTVSKHQKPGRGKEQIPYRLQREYDFVNTLISISSLQKCEKINHCCSKSPSLWYFVMAALGKGNLDLKFGGISWAQVEKTWLFWESRENYLKLAIIKKLRRNTNMGWHQKCTRKEGLEWTGHLMRWSCWWYKLRPYSWSSLCPHICICTTRHGMSIIPPVIPRFSLSKGFALWLHRIK